ncbi:MAG: transglycosylase domain-containing protein [Elusimicrobia bacterium]|nr:transglycosylase domain-containing protein [Elusimicrobiota bacterium]
MAYIAKEVPSTEHLQAYTPNLVTRVYDKDRTLIAEFFVERRVLVPLSEMPPYLINAFLAIEDYNFFTHWGVCIRGITRAFVHNIRVRRVSQGGSTITQQLAKTLFLTPARTAIRKIEELIITIQIERDFTKEEIFQLYLNQINFGAGAWGVEAAARVYFGKNVSELTLAESALLAAIPRAPSRYNPFRHPAHAYRRRAVVLRRMRDVGFITEEQEREAREVPLPTERQIQRQPSGHYFVEYLRHMLINRYGFDKVHTQGLTVFTTLDLNAQIAAEAAMEEALNAFDESRAAFFERQNIENPPRVQGALIAMDVHTGAIRAMVGGRDFRETQFNRAVQARRQPGSVFKTFVYLAAIESGFTAATLLQDKPMVFVNERGNWDLVSRCLTHLEVLATQFEDQLDLVDTMRVWTPSNFGGRFRGPVTLRRALASSINTCAVETIMAVTPMRTISYARRLGIESPLTNTLSLALGASDVTLQEITSAFSVFPAGGVRTEPFMITRIIDSSGMVLEEHIPQEREVLNPQTSFIMTNLLRASVEAGSGARARGAGRPVAGKTGTTNNHTDVWFVGFSPELAAGVWVGYDDPAISLGDRQTGGVLAAPIWANFMRGALYGVPVQNFAEPENIDWAFIEPNSGLLALSRTPGAYLEAFIRGTAPTRYFNHAETTFVFELFTDDEEGF